MAEPETAVTRTVRCAVYTRKSTEEGLEQAFNTLDAQREAAEAYIQSQRQCGWIAIPERYDDGGFSGASLERPAVQRLLASVDSGEVDCVVVYKVDRLSRSLLDFARLMERFERQGVSFVSVTQDFNTTTSLGRLTLNILLSFAQFEREIISERTRDKLSAARRKGKWIGGWPVLGYDIHAKGGRLVVNAREAEQVLQIYAIAEQSETLEATLRAVRERGLRTKAWTSQGGKRHVARPFSRMTLRLLLSNVLYTGAVNHKGTVYPGEHDGIVERDLWERVNVKLSSRGADRRGRRHHFQEAPLVKILCCAKCGSAMLPSYTTRHGRKYRYYGCVEARSSHGKRCSQAPVEANDLEASVLRNLAPVLGSRLNWDSVRDAIERVQYDSGIRQVHIAFKDASRLEYQLPVPNRPGVKSEDGEVESGRVPRVSRLVALAIKFERLIQEGRVKNHRALAEAGRVSRARMSQIMRLADLAPEIQEQLLYLPQTVAGSDRITERSLRQIARSADWEQQKKEFAKLMARVAL